MPSILSTGHPAPAQPVPVVDSDWVLQQHRQQQEVNAQLAQGLSAIQETLSLLTPATSRRPSQPAPLAQEPANSTTLSRKPRHSLSHPDKYDGENRAAYPTFKGHLRAKLRIDAAAIGGEVEQVWYGFGRLAGKAADRIFPWLSRADQSPEALRVDDFFNQLDAAFLDPQSVQRALEWVNTQKQEATPFRDFLQEFEQKLLEAGGWAFSDGVRKGYLKAAINMRIKSELVAQAEPNLYSEYVNLLQRTSDNLDELDRIKGGGKLVAKPPNNGYIDDRGMDWEPSPRTGSGRPPAQHRNG